MDTIHLTAQRSHYGDGWEVLSTLRMPSKHQGHPTVYKLHTSDRDPGRWYLVPQATVISAHPLPRPKPIEVLALADVVLDINGSYYTLRDDKWLHDPQVHAADLTARAGA